jgi:hypothetical protein
MPDSPALKKHFPKVNRDTYNLNAIYWDTPVTLHVLTDGDGNGYTLQIHSMDVQGVPILLGVEKKRDTPCTLILLAAERDNPVRPYQRTFILHLYC